ncbi:MAG: DUF4838 domain-containing protein [Oscillospiraceae bacterium]|nr:DUF4838 domain-containing protein [Oscillospiraceae bacterium]
MKIISGGTTDYRIVIPECPTQSERFAADELAKYFFRITGVSMTVCDENAPLWDKEIVIGRAGIMDSGIDFPELGEEGYALKSLDEKFYIAGGTRGVIYGVYSLLEDLLGCGFFAPDCECVPKLEELSLPETDIKIIPVFSFRDAYWHSAFDTDYAVKRKLNNASGRPIPDSCGGGVSYAGSFVHTFNHLVDPDIYFESHPEYYGLTESGERKPYQLCLSNHKVFDTALESVKKLLRENPGARIISVSQNDGGNPCVCPACSAFDRDHGGTPSASIINFANMIAEAIENEFPDVLVDTLAYQYSRSAPEGIVPRENVIVRLCSIECCFSHPIDDCRRTARVAWDSAVSKKSFPEDLNEWGLICKHIHIWDYTTDYSHYLSVFPNFNVLRQNVGFFADNSAVGIFEQGNYSSISGEFGELKAYLLSRLLWNPYMTEGEYSGYIDTFCNAYYGAGGKYIREYIDFCHSRARDVHFGINHDPLAIIPYETESDKYAGESFLKIAEELFDSAMKASDDEIIRSRIAKSAVQLVYYGALLDDKRQNHERLEAANRILYDLLMKFGITHISEWGHLRPENEIDFTKSPVYFMG